MHDPLPQIRAGAVGLGGVTIRRGQFYTAIEVKCLRLVIDGTLRPI